MTQVNPYDVRDKLVAYLGAAKQGTVWLEQLECVFQGEHISYDAFAEVILTLEQEGLLSEVKSAGKSGKAHGLARRYRIQQGKLRTDFHLHLHKLRLDLHPLISLDRYFSLSETALAQDRPYLQLIDFYLRQHGLPEHIVAAPERSYGLVQDEKWISEKGGKSLLNRIGLWDKLLIAAEYDPLMMAVNALLLTDSLRPGPCLHLIVENKTTFQALLPTLPESGFHTLIYGCGNKIVGNIDMFPKQFPVLDKEHRFYYFGDIDYKGIQIWSDLSRKIEVSPAIPFYVACIAKASATGKENQKPDKQALKAFLNSFTEQEWQRIEHTLVNGQYYPQEILSTGELQAIWRETRWS